MSEMDFVKTPAFNSYLHPVMLGHKQCFKFKKYLKMGSVFLPFS